MMRGVRKRLLVSCVLAIGIGAALAGAYHSGLFPTLQARSTDLLFKSRPTERARAAVIVGIDQRSYRELLPRYGPLARWPRTLYAHAVEDLHKAGARVIVFDIIFDAPMPDDPQMIAAVKHTGNVLMPVEAQGPKAPRPIPGVAQEFDVFVRPTTAIRDAAAGEGVVNVSTDRDAVVRALPLLLRAGSDDIPALALAVVAQFVRRPAVLDAPPEEALVHGAGRTIPLTPAGSMTINYLGPPSSPERGGSFTIIPFVDVVKGTFDRSQVRDKIVLLGQTIRGQDELSTPTTADTRMWGVEVLGNAVETILGQRYLVPASLAAIIALIFGLALSAALLVATRTPAVAAAGVVGVLGAYIIIAAVKFEGGTVLDLIHPPAALLLTFVAALIYRVVFEQAEQQTIRGAMGRYLSPSVSQWVLAEPDRIDLGGESREMTVLFCDLRGFTTLAHSMEAHALVSLLNEFMTAMTQVIFKHDGVLDKYIGDAIMAFWNAPMAQPDHARRACAAALDMIGRLRELQADWERRGVPKLELGIGINTGSMVVGNMGSRERLAYTVLGDAVNVASRLEGLSKEYGTRVVIGEATRTAAGEAFQYRFLDRVKVKGRNEPLSVFELVGR